MKKSNFFLFFVFLGVLVLALSQVEPVKATSLSCANIINERDRAKCDSCTSQGREFCPAAGSGYTCCVKQYSCARGGGCKYDNGSGKPTVPPTIPPTIKPTIPPTVPPTVPPATGQCSNIKIYTTNWVQLTTEAFSGLTPKVQVYFCVNGVTSGGAFDRARFTINSVQRPDTTIKRPGSNDYCDLYTIPYGVVNFAVQGELHHTTLGWL